MHRSVFVALAVTGFAGVVMLGGSADAVQNTAAGASSPQFYAERVQPILQENCYRCHAGLNHRGDLQLDTRAALLHGGRHGVVVVPGHPEQSLLVTLIRYEPTGDHKPMPPKSKLPDTDIATITEWIRGGAVMPDDPAK